MATERLRMILKKVTFTNTFLKFFIVSFLQIRQSFSGAATLYESKFLRYSQLTVDLNQQFIYEASLQIK